MTRYLLINETVRIAWQTAAAVDAVEKWIRDGHVSRHCSDDGRTLIVVNWGQVATIRLDEYGGALQP